MIRAEGICGVDIFKEFVKKTLGLAYMKINTSSKICQNCDLCNRPDSGLSYCFFASECITHDFRDFINAKRVDTGE